MIAQLLSFLTAIISLLAGAPDGAPIKPEFSIYEITSPHPNQIVTDEVDIIGSVNSPNFVNFFVEVYRVVGGVEDWFPATLPYRQPVFNDRIGTFNTRFLPDGEYRLRLMIRTNNQGESTLAFGPIIVSNSQKVVVTPTPEGRASDVTAVVESPRSGQVLSGSVDFVGTVDAPDLRNFFIELASADGDWDGWFAATLPRINSVQSDLLGTWNTTLIIDGDYHLRLNVLAGAEPRQHIPIGVFKVRNDS